MFHHGATGYVGHYSRSKRWHLDRDCAQLPPLAPTGRRVEIQADSLDELAQWQDGERRRPCTRCALPEVLADIAAGATAPGRTALACPHPGSPRSCQTCAALGAHAAGAGHLAATSGGRVAVLLPGLANSWAARSGIFRDHHDGPGTGDLAVPERVTAPQWNLAWALVHERGLWLGEALRAAAGLTTPAALTAR